MDVQAWAALALSVIAILLMPTLGLLIRVIVRWTKTEAKLDGTVEDLDKLVKDKDETHRVILEQMTADRNATDKRLRWLETHLWERKRWR